MLRRLSKGSPSLVLTTLILFGLAEPVAFAQVPSPPPPAEYQVWLRYRLRTAPTERPGHFYHLLDALEAQGFKKAAGPEGEEADPTVDRMTGTIVSGNARKLLRDPRVQALVLAPTGFKLPDDADAPVKVQLELLPGLALDRQRLLVDQVRPLLAELGFKEHLGYDHRGHTRLVGTVPAGRLDTLLLDLRWQTTGWLLPETRVAQLSAPLRNRWPLVVTEVIPEPEGVAPAKDVPVSERAGPDEEHLIKLTPEVRALTVPEGETARLIRMEVVLANAPREELTGWDRELASLAPGTRVEGRLGQVATVLTRPDLAAVLAQSPLVASIRLPRMARPQRAESVGNATVNRDLLLESGLERLHKLGHRGKGIRVGIIDTDFRGHAALLGKQLPRGTRLVDLTAERSLTLTPDPLPTTVDSLGSGTQAALGVALAAPDAELTLIRIDPAAPYMMRDAARYIDGAPVRSVGLVQRAEELDADADRLAARWEQLNADRAVILNNFGQDELSVKRRTDFYRKEAELKRDETALHERRGRYLQLRRDLQALRGIAVVVSNLTWDAGHPVDGGSALSRRLDDQPSRALWFQAVGNTRGQVWTGTFADADGNGVLEFAETDISLRARRWTRELNFLGWQDQGGTEKSELPGKARVRVSIQWREPHEPGFLQRGEDLYRTPLANLRLLVLRQRDPSGAKLPADALEVVARSASLPQRLDNQPGSAVYEQTVEFTLEEAGVFALRIEGQQPRALRPPGMPTLPEIQKSWELRPRVVVQVLDEASAAQGRPVFLDYRTEEGTLGMPADARAVMTVGAVSESGRPRASNATGPVLNLQLLPKPDVRAYDGWYLDLAGSKVAERASLAAPFAAGLAASVLSSGAPPAALGEALGSQAGAVLRVPER